VDGIAALAYTLGRRDPAVAWCRVATKSGPGLITTTAQTPVREAR